LYRYVNNSVLHLVDQTGLAGVGHHYFPVSVAEAFFRAGLIDEEAYYYALGYYSGQTRPNHCYGTYGGYSHAQYNVRVYELFEQYCKRRKISAKRPATWQQMEDFIKNELRNSDDPIIKGFNEAIDAQRKAMIGRAARPGALQAHPDKVEAELVIRRGKTVSRQKAYWRAKATGALLGLIMAAATEAAQALEVASRPGGAFSKAFQALAEGDLHRANLWMRGTAGGANHDGFYDELVDANLYRAALWFDAKWTQLVHDAQAGRFR